VRGISSPQRGQRAMGQRQSPSIAARSGRLTASIATHSVRFACSPQIGHEEPVTTAFEIAIAVHGVGVRGRGQSL
jgi:hypothetical protein